MNVDFKYTNGRVRSMPERDAKILTKLRKGSYLTRDMRAQPVPEVSDDELTALRAEYQAVVGKRAYHAWDADTLREKIAEAQG